MQQPLRTHPAALHDMWSREPKQARIHHTSLRDRLHRHSSPKALEPNLETTKAVAWAVFQHHGGGDGNNRGHSQQQHYSVAGRRPSRFKIEAQMKHEIAHRSFTPAIPHRWDAGSTLFDSFELDSLLKTLDRATHPHYAEDDEDDEADTEDAGALVLYQSPKQSHGVTQTRYLPEDEDDEEDEYIFTPKKRALEKPVKEVALEKPVKEVAHHNMWKSFLHSLHLDGFQKLQSQVTPHDVEKKQGRSHKVHHNHRDMDRDGQHGHRLWKLSFKAALKGHEQDQADLRSAWAAALNKNLRDEPPVHHHHHHHYQHHHHHHDEGEDYEMTVQAITKRAARTSLDESRRRVSMDFEHGGLEAPRNSLDIDERDRAAVQPKALSLWDVFEL